MKLAYFTGGTAGAGHLVRGLAIGQALGRAGYSGDMRMFIPTEPMAGLQTALAPYSSIVCPVDPEEVLDRERAPRSKLAAALVDYAPDLLIVDMFWAPLIHIVPLLNTESWLLVRSCPDHWLRGTETTRFDASQYRRVIGIDPLTQEENSEHIDPIVICNPDEAKTREELDKRWGIESGRRVVAITHAGLHDEISSLRSDYDDSVGADEDDAFIIESDLHKQNAVFPLAIWLPVVDQIHSFGGYNSYWESRWMNYAHKTVVRVTTRAIDDPLARLEAGRSYRMRENGANVIARSIVD
jgi:hypothetical protein